MRIKKPFSGKGDRKEFQISFPSVCFDPYTVRTYLIIKFYCSSLTQNKYGFLILFQQAKQSTEFRKCELKRKEFSHSSHICQFWKNV